MTKATLDWEESLQLANNEEQLAKDLLDMLIKELPEFQAEFKKAIQSNDRNQLKQQSHKLHGACCYIGVPKLRQLTEMLEDQSQSINQDQLANLVNQINSEIEAVMRAIREAE